MLEHLLGPSGVTRGGRTVKWQYPKRRQKKPQCVFDICVGIQQGGLGCGAWFCKRHAHARDIRDQVVIVCYECLVARPKQMPKRSVRLSSAGSLLDVDVSAPLTSRSIAGGGKRGEA
eukprot:4094192-Amphidinium_carterae.1